MDVEVLKCRFVLCKFLGNSSQDGNLHTSCELGILLGTSVGTNGQMLTGHSGCQRPQPIELGCPQGRKRNSTVNLYLLTLLGAGEMYSCSPRSRMVLKRSLGSSLFCRTRSLQF